MKRLAVAAKLLFTRCENSSQNLGCSKDLLLTLDNQKKKFNYNLIINLTIQKSVLNHLKHLFHRGNSRAEFCSRRKTSVH